MTRASKRNGVGFEPWTGLDGPGESSIHFVAEIE
jgi:hypothetical protein